MPAVEAILLHRASVCIVRQIYLFVRTFVHGGFCLASERSRSYSIYTDNDQDDNNSAPLNTAAFIIAADPPVPVGSLTGSLTGSLPGIIWLLIGLAAASDDARRTAPTQMAAARNVCRNGAILDAPT
jgi:hypothetical protein